jgi:acyl-CoA synthetase (AMP-forming)/AMP-acid ligase II
VTYWGLLCQAAADHPERVILADDYGRTLTTSQLRDATERVAAGLRVTSGDKVSWQMPTCLEAVVLMMALSRLDATQNPIIMQLRERELRIITNQLDPALYITPSTWRGYPHADVARHLGCKVLALDFDGEPGPELRLPTGDPSSLPPPPAHDPYWIYYTSGTTADPKGVKHTDSSLIASASGVIELSGLRHPEVYPISFPVAHIGGINMLTCCLRAGLKLVVFDRWDPLTTPERMAALRPTILGSAQPFFRAYIDAQRRHGDEPLFPEVHAFIAGGAPTSPEIAREVNEAFGASVVGSYGLTEFPIATAATESDPDDVLLRSVGKPSPGVEIRLVDGEVWLKGPQAFSGYVDASLDGDTREADGWVRSGDLGAWDDDGNLYITGRLKDIIIRNAENISALEIEDVILRHPDVVDVAVVGLPDPRTGERVCAVITLRDDSTLDVPALAAHCQANGLAKYKCPEQVEIVSVLERNSMGKLLKQQLREQLMKS